MFTGDVWFDVTAQGQTPSRLRVNLVRFAPAARTAWHYHANGQVPAELVLSGGLPRGVSRASPTQVRINPRLSIIRTTVSSPRPIMPGWLCFR